MAEYDGFFPESGGEVSLVGESARAFERARKPAEDAPKELCWHCCHSFDWQGLPMPIDYDSRRDAFTVVGNFCGIGCMKAYNGKRITHMREVNYTNISLFALRCFGKRISVPPAPPRNSLLAFGGTLTIEEFRAKSSSDAGLIGDGPTVVFAEDDSFRVPSPPDDMERRVPRQGETRDDFSDRDPVPPSDDEKNKKKKPKASSAKKRPPRSAPPPTDDAVLKLKRSRCDDADQPKPTGMLAARMGIEISEIPPER